MHLRIIIESVARAQPRAKDVSTYKPARQNSWTKSRQKSLKVVTSEKIGGSGVISTLGTWYGVVVIGSFDL